MKKAISVILVIIMTLLFSSCGAQGGNGENASYTNITADEAKAIMDSDSDYVILDVRTEEEFAEGHIPDAILIPDYEIEEKAEGILTDKEQQILVYCRSGRRSKEASQTLADLGYTNVKEFGGIINWPYEVVTE